MVTVEYRVVDENGHPVATLKNGDTLRVIKIEWESFDRITYYLTPVSYEEG